MNPFLRVISDVLAHPGRPAMFHGKVKGFETSSGSESLKHAQNTSLLVSL